MTHMTRLQTTLMLLLIMTSLPLLSTIAVGFIRNSTPQTTSQLWAILFFYSLFPLIGILIIHKWLGVSTNITRTFFGIIPLMWLFYVATELFPVPRIVFTTGMLDYRIEQIKTVIMTPQYMTRFDYTFFGMDIAAILGLAFAFGPLVRGHPMTFFPRNENMGSGDTGSTARLADARWATPKEVKENLSASGGIVLGEYTNRAMQFTPAPTRYSIYPVPIETITHNI